MGCWTNKENVPISNTIQRLARTNKVPNINPKGKWLRESLEVAMDAVERNLIFLQRPTNFRAYM
jgi:hypothetical protein